MSPIRPTGPSWVETHFDQFEVEVRCEAYLDPSGSVSRPDIGPMLAQDGAKLAPCGTKVGPKYDQSCINKTIQNSM